MGPKCNHTWSYKRETEGDFAANKENVMTKQGLD